MVAGVSTACFYPELTEYALEYLAEAGVKAVEVFFNAPSELEGEPLRRMHRIVQETGIQVISVHPFTSGIEPLLFFSGYKRRHQDGIELYKRYFYAANELGAEIFVFHGDQRISMKSDTFYFERFGALMEAGKHMGITVAQENVPRCRSWQPEFFAKMRKALPQARFVLDVKQCRRAEVSVERMLAGMGDRVIHLHLSDYTAQNDCLPVGKGMLNLPDLLRKMQKYGFDGSVMQEVYRDSYGEYSELLEGYRKISLAVSCVSAH